MIFKKLQNSIVFALLPTVILILGIGDGLTPAQQRGKLIYTKGKRSDNRPIRATLSGATFDAKILPCINCHGVNGQGNPEGGVEPSPLDWSSLTKPYALEFKNGRKRTAYTHPLFLRAVQSGLDASSNTLDPVMPLYDLNSEDVDDLIEYLKVIRYEYADGVNDSTITVGVILPESPSDSPKSDAIQKTVEAYIDLVNLGGGLYQRLIQVRFYWWKEGEAGVYRKLLNDLEEQTIFSLIASDLSTLSNSQLKILQQHEVPVIGAIEGNPSPNGYLKGNIYYLFSGLEQEIQHLIDYTQPTEKSDQKSIILYDSLFLTKHNSIFERIQAANPSIKIQLTNGENGLQELTFLQEKAYSNLILLTASRYGRQILETLDELNWRPDIFSPGRLITSAWLDAPQTWDRKLHFSYPTWISQRDDRAMQQYYKMMQQYQLSDAFLASQLHALVSTILFTEVVKTVGKDLNQKQLIDAIQAVQSFDTGFMAPLSFGPNRRIGSENIYILQADLVNKSLVDKEILYELNK